MRSFTQIQQGYKFSVVRSTPPSQVPDTRDSTNNYAGRSKATARECTRSFLSPPRILTSRTAPPSTQATPSSPARRIRPLAHGRVTPALALRWVTNHPYCLHLSSSRHIAYTTRTRICLPSHMTLPLSSSRVTPGLLLVRSHRRAALTFLHHVFMLIFTSSG